MKSTTASAVGIWRSATDWFEAEAVGTKPGAPRAANYAQTQAQKVQGAATAAANRARDAAIEKADELEQGTERLIEKGVSGVTLAADGTRKAAERVRDKLGDIL